MTLYHFCSDKHIKNIMHKGLNVGGLTEPRGNSHVVHSGWTWLTTDPEPKNQSWATQHKIKYSRTAWRLTVEIPEVEEEKLFDRQRIAQIYPPTDLLFDGWPGSENWRVFHGSIPRKWIVSAERMEGK